VHVFRPISENIRVNLRLDHLKWVRQFSDEKMVKVVDEGPRLFSGESLIVLRLLQMSGLVALRSVDRGSVAIC